MGMGFNIITSPDLLSPPPPGLVSCFQTSVNPDDAQICELINGGEETMPPSNITEEPTRAPTVPPTSAAAPTFHGGWLRIVGTLVFASLGTATLI